MRADPADLLPGYATRAATEAYARTFGAACGAGHYSEFLNRHLQLSSLGIGTFPGAATDVVDEAYATVVARALAVGINVVDTAAHYRWGRSAVAVGEGLRRAFDAGVAREQVYVIGKGGFLLFEDGPPADLDAWFEAHIARRGLGRAGERSGMHLLSPGYLGWQIDRLRADIGIATLDAFLVDQPEVQVPALGKEAMHRALERVFAVCELAVKQGRIRAYGISTFNALRTDTDADDFQSIAALLGMAQRAAQRVQGATDARHGLRWVTAPYNALMPEAFTRFSQATGKGNVASTVQAAHQLGVYFAGSHGLAKGCLAQPGPGDPLAMYLPGFANPAQRALQFNRSTPGVGVSLVGVHSPDRLDDVLAVARVPPLARAAFLALWERVG
jgi:aryl-alcohol dehydrogenase-like predicted oxidoreductase